MKVSKGTIIRTSILVLALVNTSLQLMGWDVLPFGEEQLESAITIILNTGASLTVWWKNNSFSDEAIKADKVMKEKKERRKLENR